MPQEVFIGSGANLGDRRKALEAALELLAPEVRVLRVSQIYETPPWGYEEQPIFLNQAIQAETELDPPALLKHLKHIERKIGRKATFLYGPRAIDLDILFYGEQVYEAEDLHIPHPLAAERAFVLVPLCEIAPDLKHPLLGRTMRELTEGMDTSGIKIYEEDSDGKT